MAAKDTWNAYHPLPDPAYANAAAAAGGDDNNDLAAVSRAIYVGGAGDVTVVMQGGGTITFKAVPVGTLLRVRATRIKSTLTTASNLVALW